MPGGEAHGVVATHRVPDQGHPLPTQRIHDAEEVRRELLGAVPRVGRPVALPVAPLVERDDVEPVNERGHHRVEPMGMGRAAMEEAQRGAAGLAPLERAESHAVDTE